MKRGKKLLVLLLVLVAVMGATWAAGMLNPENQEVEEAETGTTVFTMDTSTITALSWDYSEKVSFEKDGDTWVYTGDSTFPLEQTYLDAMLETLAEIVSYKTIEAVEDWDQYTLEVPYCTIAITADGVDYTLKIGEETAMGGQRYLSIGDGNAYIVDDAVLDPFAYGLYDVLAYEVIPDMSGVTALTVTSGEAAYEVEKLEGSGLAYSDDYVWFLENKALDTELTEELLDSVIWLDWVECVNFHAEDLEKYGLDDPAVTVSVSYDGGVFTLEFGAETGKYRYARIAGSQMVYTVDADVAETLMYTTYNDLQPDEVLVINWEDVTGLDITLDGVTYEAVKGTKTVTDDEGNETEETIWLLSGEEAELDDITALLDAMDSSGYAAGLTPERSEEIRFTIHRDHETYPEVELVFYRYDSTTCLTTLNGEATVFVSRTDVVELVEEVNSLVLD